MAIHLGVDSDTGEITAVGLTDNTSHDGSQVEKLLDQTDKELSAVGGDGAYDTWDVYDAITDREATPVIPPRRNAEIKKHGNCSGPPLPRDEAIRYIRAHRRKKWKRTHGYHRRSLAEAAVCRSGTAHGTIRGGSQVRKRKGRGEAQGQDPEPNDPARHAANKQGRCLNEDSQLSFTLPESEIFIQGRFSSLSYERICEELSPYPSPANSP